MFKDICQAMISLLVLHGLCAVILILYIPFRIFGIDILKIIEVKIDDILR
jgi:hypothetical protein